MFKREKHKFNVDKYVFKADEHKFHVLEYKK